MKIVLINDCDNCPFVYPYLGTTECCTLKNRRVCHIDEEMYLDAHIPDWCPLQTASQEAVDAQEQLRGKL